MKILGDSRADTCNFFSSKSFKEGLAYEYSVKEAVEFNSNVNAKGEGKRRLKIYRLPSRKKRIKQMSGLIFVQRSKFEFYLSF